jgi:hypothetical protein
MKLDFMTITTLFFPLHFIVESSLVEVNDGTSVRLRQVFLIHVLVDTVNQISLKPKQTNHGDGIY